MGPAGKAGLGQIFSRGATAHRHIHGRVAVGTQAVVGHDNIPFEFVGQRRPQDGLTDLLTPLTQIRTVNILVCLCVLSAVATPETTVQPLEIGTGEQLLVITPHPDDETLGAAGLLQRVLAREGRARIVVLTAGDGYIEAVQHATGHLYPRPAEGA